MIAGIQAQKKPIGILSQQKPGELAPKPPVEKEKGPNIGALLSGAADAKKGIAEKLGQIDKIGEANKQKINLIG